MDYVLLIISLLLMIGGVLGCILPAIPGPPLSFVGLLLLHFTDWVDYSSSFLVGMFLLAVAVTVIDFFVPVWMTKKFGGSKSGSWGSFIGMVIGMFFYPPWGLILGAFFGAFIGEMIHNSDSTYAFKAAFGSFVGFLLGVGLKLVTSLYMTVVFVQSIWEDLIFPLF